MHLSQVNFHVYSFTACTGHGAPCPQTLGSGQEKLPKIPITRKNGGDFRKSNRPAGCKEKMLLGALWEMYSVLLVQDLIKQFSSPAGRFPKQMAVYMSQYVKSCVGGAALELQD